MQTNSEFIIDGRHQMCSQWGDLHTLNMNLIAEPQNKQILK